MKNKNDDEKLHKEALKRFSLAEQAERDERSLALEDMLFVNEEDGQWPNDQIEKRKDQPCFTVDRITPAIDQVAGRQRQSRSGIDVIPLKNGTKEISEIYSGLIRSIENNPNWNASNAYDNASDEQITCGYGGWRIITEEEYLGFDQNIIIKPINSAVTSLYFSPNSECYDKRDSRWAFLLFSSNIDLFKEEYPDASIIDFANPEYQTDLNRYWFSDDQIQLAEYWYKIEKETEIAQLNDGRVIDLVEESAVLDELQKKGFSIVKQRTAKIEKVEMRIMNGVEFLTGPQPWAGRYIPLIPVFGKQSTVKNKKYVRGITRKAKDPARIYNYTTSALVTATAMTPKDPIMQTPVNIKGLEAQWRTFNTENPPTMLYNPDPANAGAPPSRGGAPVVQQALIQQNEQAKIDIHATTLVEPASLGNIPVVKSGVAIQEEDEKGDRGSYVYGDNQRKSMQYTGDILIDLIPRILDGSRVEQILGVDGVSKEVEINQVVTDNQTKKQVIVNDLSQGTYSAIAKTGPSYSSRRGKTVDQLTTLSQTSPIIEQLALDVIVNSMDLVEGEEVHKRLRKRMINEGIIEPTEEEVEELGLDKPIPPNPMDEALVDNLNMQTEKLISEIEKNDAEREKKIIEGQKQSVQALVEVLETMLKKHDKGLPITENDLDIIHGQEVLVQETQQDVLEGQQIANSLPMNAKNLDLSQLEQTVEE